MNYIKYLSDARLINMLYRPGESFPKKPARVMMHNTNLMYAIYPNQMVEADIHATFFQNALWAYHDVRIGEGPGMFIVDGHRFRICQNDRRRTPPDCTTVRSDLESSRDNSIPLWLFGFLY